MSSPFCSRKKVDMLRCFQPNLGGKIKGLSFYFFVFLQVKTQTLKMTIVGGLRIIDSNAQTGTMW
jgi:hypothetical protein